jgi:hypothetical protein
MKFSLAPFKNRKIQLLLCLALVAVLAVVPPLIVHFLGDPEITNSGRKAITSQLQSGVQSTSTVPTPFTETAAITPFAPVQRELRDCRFLSSLSSFVCTTAGASSIQKMIQVTPTGYTVTFPGDAAHPVSISPLTPTELTVCASPGSKPSCTDRLWVAIIEKAYGQYRLDHMSLQDKAFYFLQHTLLNWQPTPSTQLPSLAAAYGSGDDRAIELLTNSKVQSFDTLTWQCGEFGLGKGYVTMRQMKSWLNRPAVLAEFKAEQDAALRTAISKHATIIAATNAQPHSSEYGLQNGHAYAVLAYFPSTHTLRLRDPFATGDYVDPTTGRIRDSANDGTFDLTLDEFNDRFSKLYIGGY